MTALLDPGGQHPAAVADAAVAHEAVGADLAALADDGVASQDGAGAQDGVGADADAGVHIGGGGVFDGDAGAHEVFEDAAAEDGLGLGKLDAVVDAHGLLVLRFGAGDVAALVEGDADEVGEVVFAVLVGREAVEMGPEPGGVEAADAGVDLGDAQFCLPRRGGPR